MGQDLPDLALATSSTRILNPGFLNKMASYDAASTIWQAVAWGGHLELWPRNMSECGANIRPTFNRLVVGSRVRVLQLETRVESA